MKTKVSSITLLAGILLILVPDISSAQGNYNPQAAVNYAEQWWNGRNSIDPGECDPYRDYGKYDCANFVSQCLHDVNGGGLDLNAPDYSCGCFSTCTLLHDYLIKYPGIQWLPTLKGDPIPDFFKAGDPAMFGYTEPNGVVHQRSHAVFAVAGEGDYAICNAHSPNDSNTIQEFYEKYPSFDRCTYYHIPRVFSGAGSGTEQDPYLITNVQQLQEMNDDLRAWYALGNDIDASDTRNWDAGKGFSPVGHGYDYSIKFTGHFDGRGNIISGLYINRPDADYVGLFGYTSSPEIKDVGLIDVDVTGGGAVGGLIGCSAPSYGHSRARCYTTGTVRGVQYVGGLIGSSGKSDITDCYSMASVYGDSQVGGLIGYKSGYSGGQSTNANVINCYSAGLVNDGVAGTDIGGLAGRSMRNNWKSCYWDIESSGQTTSAGGLGKTTMEMKWQVTFTFTGYPWDFETIWNIEEDATYPFLRMFDDDPQSPPPSQITGSGTEQDPYIITKIKELQAMNNHLHASYALSNGIDASDTRNWDAGKGFSPVGHGYDYSIKFTGHFDGRGNIISGLYINRPDADYVGLFGYTSSPEIKDVGLIDVDVNGGGAVGGLIGCSAPYYGHSRARCYTTGTVRGVQYVGGLIGSSGKSDITDCYSMASVSGDSQVGGLIGYKSGYSGGQSTNANVINCYSAGLVNDGVAGTDIGGLAGRSMRTNWNSCYWDITNSGQTTSVGGLGKTKTEMKQQATFFGWDFNTVWDIVEGQSYPFLLQFGPPELPLPEDPYIIYIKWSSGAPGITVTIYGRNFDKITERVTFGFKTAEILDWSDDTIWAKVPEPLYDGERTVEVTAGGIFSQKTNSVPFTYKLPVLDKVYPSYGKPGDEITFEGQHFGEVQHTVEFGRSLVLPISRNDTEIVAKAPWDLGFVVEEWIILQLMKHVANGVIPGSGYLLDVVYDLEAGGVEFDWSGGDIDVEARVISGVGRSDAKRFTFNVYEVIAMALSSPGEPRIIDAHGNVTGVVDGQIRREIPYSFYANETALLVNPDSSYSYEVVGTGEGTYGLQISHICDGSSQEFEAVSIPIAPGSTQAYTVDWQVLSAGEEGVILEIDNNGDGFFEQMVIADNELSYDEFALQTETVVDFDPDTLNLKSKGKFVTVYIELPDDFNVSDIDLFSLALNELVPPLPKPIEIGDYDSDGTNDLMVKFDRQELIELLEPGEQIIDLTGRLWDGRLFAGFDFIRVIH